ncbi:hypothetical protein [Streptomyces sp. NPDC101178]|uniref:hypothetical protein n=1 Tax=Streptomyces sp. NPDC101178 TaxID=3366124 RepID=UPI0038111AB9
MNTLGPRSVPRLISVGYVGLVLAVALADEIAGHPSALDAAMTPAAFPGSILVLVSVLYPLNLLAGDDSFEGESGFSLLTPLFHGTGALVNVLIVWAVIAFVRHFRNEARRSGR